MKLIVCVSYVTIAIMLSSFIKPPDSPHVTAKGENISISYGQPSKKGRVIFGGLVPYNVVWRTGANEATEIAVEKSCLFAGKKIGSGTYTLFTIPGKDKWTVILNSKLGQWGAFDYEKVKDKNVLEVTVPAKHIEKVVEKMTFTVEKDAIQLQWDQTEIVIPCVVSNK